MDVIGLDLSLTSTGIATPDGEFIIKTKLKGEPRLKKLRDEILAYILPWRDPYVVIEGYSFASRSGQAFSIGELGGVVKVRLMEEEIPYSVVPPTVRAKFATGKGNSSKIDVAMAVAARTGDIFGGKGSDDKVDAWVLREMGLHAAAQQGQFEWPKQNLEALEKVEWA